MPPRSKPQTDDFRLYLETEFNGIHEKIRDLKVQSEKTDASVQGVIRTINQMQLVNVSHYQECPNTKDMETVKRRMLEISFYERHWKTFAIAGAVFIFSALIAGYEAVSTISDLKIKYNAIKTESQNKPRPVDNKTLDTTRQSRPVQ